MGNQPRGVDAVKLDYTRAKVQSRDEVCGSSEWALPSLKPSLLSHACETNYYLVWRTHL